MVRAPGIPLLTASAQRTAIDSQSSFVRGQEGTGGTTWCNAQLAVPDGFGLDEDES